MSMVSVSSTTYQFPRGHAGGALAAGACNDWSGATFTVGLGPLLLLDAPPDMRGIASAQ